MANGYNMKGSGEGNDYISKLWYKHATPIIFIDITNPINIQQLSGMCFSYELNDKHKTKSLLFSEYVWGWGVKKQ